MKTLLISCLALCQLIGNAQTIDYDKIIIPEKVITASFKERLIQIAWANHPTNKSFYTKVELARAERKGAQLSWLRDIAAVGNLNEFTLHPDAITVPLGRNYYYPRYNFTVRVSLGTIFLTPLEVKQSNYKLQLSEFDVDKRKLELRSSILVLVEKLIEHRKVLKLRGQLKEDYLIMYKDVEKKFLTGQADMEKYRVASQLYFRSMEDEIRSEAEFNQAKIAIEAIVGMQLEEVDDYEGFLTEIDRQFKN